MVEFISTKEPLEIDYVLAELDRRADLIKKRKADELVWFVRHPPMYTGGPEAKQEDLINDQNLPVHMLDRGGEFVYNGPGVLNTYVMVNLNRYGGVYNFFLVHLHELIIRTLHDFGIESERRTNLVGVFVQNDRWEKISTIGFEIKNNITYHGFALHVNPDLDMFKGIVLCGLHDSGVTSMKELGVDASLEDVEEVIKKRWKLTM